MFRGDCGNYICFLLYLQYAAIDHGIDRGELYSQLVKVHHEGMEVMVKKERRCRAAERKNALLRSELKVAKDRLDVVEGCLAFCNDGE